MDEMYPIKVETLSAYQAMAAKTSGGWDTPQDRFLMAGVGLGGEIGEVAEAHVLPSLQRRDALIKEAGDIAWYAAEAATAAGLDLDTICALDGARPTLAEFTSAMTRTDSAAWSTPDRVLSDFRRLVAATGAVSELSKKHRFHKQELDREKVARAVRVVFVELAQMLANEGASLREALERNGTKLRARYPAGFDAARSTIRTGEAG